MRNFRMIICVVAAIAFLAGAVSAEETRLLPSFATSQEVAYVSKYVWRGLPINPEGAIQPSVTVSHRSGLSLNVWGSADVTGYTENSGRFTEIDYTLAYDWGVRDLNMSAGLIRYTFPNIGDTATDEIFLSVAFPGYVSPAITINYDFREADGYYFSLDGGYSYELASDKAGSLDVSGKVSFGSASHNEFYYSGANKSAITDVLLTATLPVAMNDRLTIAPSLSYSRIVSKALREAIRNDGMDSDNLFAGVVVTFSL